jgi:hypothetical protein
LNIMTASKGLRPALLFLASGASLTTASISGEAFEGDERLERLQWIALGTDRLETLVEIVEPQLTHGSPPAIICQHWNLICGGRATAIFRGAL